MSGAGKSSKKSFNQYKKLKREDANRGEDYEQDRKGWTPGWGQSMSERERETLPIKKDGKVLRQIVKDRISANNDNDDEDTLRGGKDIYSSKNSRYSDADHSRALKPSEKKQKDKEKLQQQQKQVKESKLNSNSSNSKRDAEDFDSEAESDEDAGDGKMAANYGDRGGYAFAPDFTEDNDTNFERSDEEDDSDDEDGGESSGDEDGEKVAKREKRKEKDKASKERKLRRLADQSSDEEVEGSKSKNKGKDKSSKSDADVPKEFVKGSTKNHRMAALARMPTQEVLQYVGNICRSIMDSPERSLKRRAPEKEAALISLGELEEDRDYKILDLFDVLTAKNSAGEHMFSEKVVEMCMLSMLLVFKDILPSYRIRPQADDKGKGNDVQLKKQTKATRDYELGLLGAYQRYIKVISAIVLVGLGPVVLGKKARAVSKHDTKESQLGLSALRCQCELLQAAPYFNFRGLLLKAVINRAAVHGGSAHSMSCEALVSLFTSDRQGEASLEAVRVIATLTSHVKFGNIPEELVKTLTFLKLEVRAQEAKSLKMKAKRDRRKRRRAEDDIAAHMTENSVDTEKITVAKLQANCLHEVSLIYFRIIKGKIGFALLPIALEGVGKIAHLLNIETMEELVELMRGLLDKPEGGTGLPPAPIQLQCIACALRILNGPGEAIGIDLHFFSARLALLMSQLPATFTAWDTVIECVVICCSKRQHERAAPVQNFVRILLHCAGHQQASTGVVTLLSAVHSLLLRHVRVRARMLAIEGGGGDGTIANKGKKSFFEEDDEVADHAMMPLMDGRDSLEGGTGGHDSVMNSTEDGSWMLPLLRQHADPMVKHVVSFVTSKDVNPLPLRMGDARFNPISLLDRADSALDAVSKVIDRDTHRRASTHNKSRNNAERKSIEKKEQAYQEQFDRKWQAARASEKMLARIPNSNVFKAFFPINE